jgi:DNA-binding CsgD family transcriptional regulator
MRHESLAHIALHARAEDVLGDAVATARRVAGTASAFAGVADLSGGYRIAIREGLCEPAWDGVEVRSGRGLGGRVLTEARPLVAADYLDDPTITGDYRDIVRAEGLHGIACVPVMGPEGFVALLYVGERVAGPLGSRLVDELSRIADMATVGLTVLARKGREESGETADRPAVDIHLTPREREVLDLLVAGASNRQIAQRLVLAESTVKGYVRTLLEKLDSSSRLQAVATARRWRVIDDS